MKVAVLSFAHERAATYARLLSAMPGVELVVADPDGALDDPARGQVTSRRLGASYVDSWDEVFALGPDAVVVTSEVAGRRELVERAARAGAQVLCEHPLAATEADAQSMVDACAAAGVRLTLASPACFSVAFAAVRRTVADPDAVGSLTTVYGAYGRPDPAGGGALGAHAPYLLDLVDAVLGGEPAKQVYAQVNSVLGGQSESESAALVTVRYANGTVASIDCSRSLSPDQPGAGGPVMTFVGDRASVEFDACPRLLRGFDSATSGERWDTGGTELSAAMLDDFVAGIGNGGGAGPDGAAGVRALRIVEAAYESAQTGQPVDLAVPPSERH
jgi:predicted dehydrogenase